MWDIEPETESEYSVNVYSTQISPVLFLPSSLFIFSSSIPRFALRLASISFTRSIMSFEIGCLFSSISINSCSFLVEGLLSDAIDCRESHEWLAIFSELPSRVISAVAARAENCMVSTKSRHWCPSAMNTTWLEWWTYINEKTIALRPKPTTYPENYNRKHTSATGSNNAI